MFLDRQDEARAEQLAVIAREQQLHKGQQDHDTLMPLPPTVPAPAKKLKSMRKGKGSSRKKSPLGAGLGASVNASLNASAGLGEFDDSAQGLINGPIDPGSPSAPGLGLGGGTDSKRSTINAGLNQHDSRSSEGGGTSRTHNANNLNTPKDGGPDSGTPTNATATLALGSNEGDAKVGQSGTITPKDAASSADHTPFESQPTTSRSRKGSAHRYGQTQMPGMLYTHLTLMSLTY